MPASIPAMDFLSGYRLECLVFIYRVTAPSEFVSASILSNTIALNHSDMASGILWIKWEMTDAIGL